MGTTISLDELAPELGALAREILSGVVFQQTPTAIAATCPHLVQKRYLDFVLGKVIVGRLPVGMPNLLTANLAPAPSRPVPNTVRWPTGDSAKHPLNPYYSFGTFVPNESNALALSNALSVADGSSASSPAQRVIYFHGNDGVGKTHLLSAIAKARARALWLEGTSLRHALLASMRHGTPEDLTSRAQRNQVSGTIIDAIDELEGWPLLQDELARQTEHYHFPGTFLVVSGNKSPDDLQLNPSLKQLIGAGEAVYMGSLDEQLRRDMFTVRLEHLPDVPVPENVVDTVGEAPILDGHVLVRAIHKYILSCDAGKLPTTRAINSILHSCGVSPVPASNTQVIRALAELGTTVSIGQLQGPRPGKEITAIRNSLIQGLVGTKGLSRSAVARAFKVSVQYVSRIAREGHA